MWQKFLSISMGQGTTQGPPFRGGKDAIEAVLTALESQLKDRKIPRLTVHRREWRWGGREYVQACIEVERPHRLHADGVAIQFEILGDEVRTFFDGFKRPAWRLIVGEMLVFIAVIIVVGLCLDWAAPAIAPMILFSPALFLLALYHRIRGQTATDGHLQDVVKKAFFEVELND